MTVTSYDLDYLRALALDATRDRRSPREGTLACAVLELTADSETTEIVLKLVDTAQEVAKASRWTFQEALESLMVASGYVVAPVYSMLDATHSTERRTMTLEGNQLWRKRGWIGQTGRIYGIGEDPSRTERGSFAPLWELIDDEPPVLPDALDA